MTQHLPIDTIIDFVHGELSPAQDALAHAHMQACAECRVEFERETNLSEALRRAARDDEREMPGVLRAQIWQAVRAERPSLSARLIALLRPAVAVPAAALLLVVTYFASPLGHPQGATRTIDAMYYLEQHAAEEIQNPLGDRNVSSPLLESSAGAPAETSLGTRTAAAAALDAVE